MTRINERNMEPASRWFVSEWLAALARILEQKTGITAGLGRLEPASGEPAAPDSIWWAQEFGVRERPAVWIGGAEVDCRDLTRYAGADPYDKQSYGQLLAESFTHLTQTLGARANAGVFCGTGEQTLFPPESANAWVADVSLAPGTTVTQLRAWSIEADPFHRDRL